MARHEGRIREAAQQSHCSSRSHVYLIFGPETCWPCLIGRAPDVNGENWLVQLGAWLWMPRLASRDPSMPPWSHHMSSAAWEGCNPEQSRLVEALAQPPAERQP